MPKKISTFIVYRQRKFYFKFIQMERLNLFHISMSHLGKMEQNLIKGGNGCVCVGSFFNCSCGCKYANQGGSSTKDNDNLFIFIMLHDCS